MPLISYILIFNNNMMNQKALVLLVVVSLSCTKVPITGRRQLNLMPESDLIGMSLTQYSDFLSSNQLEGTSNQNSQMVKRVGQKISTAVEKYLRDNNMSDRIEGFKWEFNLVKDDAVNAWCMPGGKVVFYTGILPITQNEAGIAVVMGHEVAHAIARHGNERMSQGMAMQVGVSSIGAAMGKNPTLTQSLFMQSVGIGSQLGMLSFSRKHESEADKMGLIFMAMAGYNPKAAPEFWKRMAAGGGQKPPEFMSTHPSDETRINDINNYMGEAMKYYKP